MRASTLVAILSLLAWVALSVSLPLPAIKYASLSCYICDAQVLSFFADLSMRIGASPLSASPRTCRHGPHRTRRLTRRHCSRRRSCRRSCHRSRRRSPHSRAHRRGRTPGQVASPSSSPNGTRSRTRSRSHRHSRHAYPLLHAHLLVTLQKYPLFTPHSAKPDLLVYPQNKSI